jgi:hypothetical protein
MPDSLGVCWSTPSFGMTSIFDRTF